MSEQNGYATKAALLAANKRRFTDVDVPGVGKMRLRSLTERERSGYESGMLGKDGRTNLKKIAEAKVALIVLCLCDAEDRQLLSSADAAALGELDSSVTNVLFDACTKHCGISETDVEELAKN